MTATKSNHGSRLMAGAVMAAWLLMAAGAHAEESKLEAVLVWGTNSPKPPESNLKVVTSDVQKKLNCLPFKYTNYFEVNRKQLALKDGGTAKASMSKDCKITVKSLEDGKVELTVIGKGQPVGKITQELKKDKCLVTGGNAENSTAWFVVIKQLE
jgi:hypothetical protein